MMKEAQSIAQGLRFQVSGQAPVAPVALPACNAAIALPSDLKPGDTLSPDARITSADGKPVQGPVSTVWTINGRQANSTTWDGQETTVTLQLSCQGHAQQFSATLPAYVEAPPDAGPGPAAIVLPAVPGLIGLGGLLGVPPVGLGGIGKVPGPETLWEALTGVLGAPVVGLAGTIIGALARTAGAAAVAGAPAAPGIAAAPQPPAGKPAPGAKPDPAAAKALQKERVEATKAAIARAMAEAQRYGSPGGLAVLTAAGAGKDVVQAGATLAQGLAGVLRHPWDSLMGALTATKQGIEGAGAVAGTLSVPLEQGLRGAWNNPLDALGAAARAIYGTVTDPHKLWDFVKILSGYDNFSNALDPNRSLIGRLGQVGLGVANLYGTLLTGGALKNGVTGLLTGKAVAPTAGIPKAPYGAVSSEGLVAKGARTVVDAGPGVVADVRGIPRSQLNAMAKIAQESRAEISIRPTKAAARAFLESGEAVPKPPTVHNTSLTKVDELIGGPANREGLVGAFEPKKPDPQTWSRLTQQERDEAMRRMETRRQEWGKLAGRRDVVVKDGVLHDVRTGKPFVSDIDLGAITRNGVPVPEDEARMIVARIRQQCPGVTHPPINEWYATGAEAKDIMARTMGGHVAGGEAMVTVTASGGTKATYFGGLARP